jgi:hypothetical protein
VQKLNMVSCYNVNPYELYDHHLSVLALVYNHALFLDACVYFIK